VDHSLCSTESERTGLVCDVQRMGWGCCVPSGAGGTAVFEPVSSKPPTPCVAMDVGSSVWDSAAPENAAPEKGWAKFTDFQPFCW